MSAIKVFVSVDDRKNTTRTLTRMCTFATYLVAASYILLMYTNTYGHTVQLALCGGGGGGGSVLHKVDIYIRAIPS